MRSLDTFKSVTQRRKRVRKAIEYNRRLDLLNLLIPSNAAVAKFQILSNLILIRIVLPKPIKVFYVQCFAFASLILMENTAIMLVSIWLTCRIALMLFE